MTNQLDDTHHDFIRRIVAAFEQHQFTKFRSSNPSSAYTAPSSIFGVDPHLTAHDPTGRFHIFELLLESMITLPETMERLTEFHKYAGKHNSQLWVFVPKGLEDTISRELSNNNLKDLIPRVKGLSLS